MNCLWARGLSGGAREVLKTPERPDTTGAEKESDNRPAGLRLQRGLYEAGR